ncbi:hypothetical protein RB195_007910 [Necator americanus]|uniref:Integrase catalytic domain-containing protein n=1 Tax=Necator americanus TaxID=51031 RepID=A0ABR1C0M8_NECAM
MATFGTHEQSIVNAIDRLETARTQVGLHLLDPFVPDGSVSEQLHQLHERQEVICSHISRLDVALSLLRERCNVMLYHVSLPSSTEEERRAYELLLEKYQPTKVQEEAETLIHTLRLAREACENTIQSIRLQQLATVIADDNEATTPVSLMESSRRSSEHQEVANNGVQRRTDVTSQIEDRPVNPTEQLSRLHIGDSTHQSARDSQPSQDTGIVPPTFRLPIQLEKLSLPTFDGEATKFQQFWCAFEMAVHKDETIDPNMKYLYLQSLLKGEAEIVLQDMEPGKNNYNQLVQALKKRYDCPRRTRALLHQQLQQLPQASEAATDMRNTWFRLSGILHSLRRFEDLNKVLSIIDLVRSKFPSFIQEKLTDTEYQRGKDLDLQQVMACLDDIITARERFEITCPRTEICTVGRDRNHNLQEEQDHNSHHSTQRRRSGTRSRSHSGPSRVTYDPTRCSFCDSTFHRTSRCTEHIPASVRRKIVSVYGLCFVCLRQGHRRGSCDYSSCRTCGGRHHPLLCILSRSGGRTYASNYRSLSRELQDYRARYRSRRDSYPSRSPARHGSRSRDYSRGRTYHRRESSYRSRSDTRSRSPSDHVSFRLPVRGHEHDSSPRDRRRRPYRSLSPSAHHLGVTSDSEYEDYVQSYVRSQLVSRPHSHSHPTLMMVKAKVLDAQDGLQTVVILLDSGSQCSFITIAATDRLGLQVKNRKPLTLVTFGGSRTTEVLGTVEVTFVDLLDKRLTILLRTKDRLTSSHRSPQLSPEDIKFINDLGFDKPVCCTSTFVEPDVLIGIDYLWEIVTQEASVCLPSGLVLTHTRFGTVVSGIADSPYDDDNAELDAHILKQFEDTSQVSDGYLYVRFPWKEDHPRLADNKQLAYCRLVNQYQRLHEQGNAWEDYCMAIDQHLQYGFIEEVSEYKFDSHLVYYIPHQAVYKESSSTTRLRVVFDASSHMRGVPSLNDCLYEGPSLLPDIAGVHLRARLHRYLLTADVEKAFHQVRLQTSQRDATRFLWLKDTTLPPSKDNLRHYRFTRIPFGVKSSPFMLAAAIRFYLKHIDSPLRSEIERNTYVDNVILGASSNQEAVRKYRMAKSTFAHMHMNLREFLCSSHVVNDHIHTRDRIKDPKRAKLLGIPWNHFRDTLHIPIKTICGRVYSKRTALRAYASTYDPLGLLTPFLASAKLFIQDLWLKKLKWDDELEQEDLYRWSRILSDLEHPLPHIPRCVTPNHRTTYELCIFGDASKRLYASCAYLVCRSSNVFTSNLVMAKSHLNETKPLTIPRMELLAIRNCVFLAQYLHKELDLTLTYIHFFTDSQITLHWIHSSRPLRQFVHNRVSSIHKILSYFQDKGVPTKFHFVASEDNPADCATRGLATKDAKNHIWWTGPSFLRRCPEQWPHSDMDFTIPPVTTKEQDQEFMEVSLIRESSHSSVLPFRIVSSYVRLVRITIYVLKFLRCKLFDRVNVQSQSCLLRNIPSLRDILSHKSLTAPEFIAAETLLIREHYRESDHILEKYKLDRFNAHMDEKGLIRCPSRMENVQVTAPILLVPSHRFTYLVIMHAHISQYHVGVYGLISHLITRYFIPSIRRTVRKVLRTCVTCRKVTGYAYRYPDMPSLPEERVKRSRPFQNVGLDYLGPIYYRDTNGIRSKVWICLITCMATRAVHLEVVNSNTTQDFLLAFRRFIARRGTPHLVYSDNATTFHSAKDTLDKVLFTPTLWNKIDSFLTNHRIAWRFITPLSPWKGGFYERLVALFKSAFVKAIGRQLLKLDQLHTVVVEIEAIINSRPITPYRENDVSIRVLKPNDFISPEVSLQLPPRLLVDDIAVSGHRLADWYKQTVTVLDSFWDIWHTDYLSALVQRHQRRLRQPRNTSIRPKVNDVVIIADDKLPRGQWQLGIIVKLIHGYRNGVRAVQVRTCKGKLLHRSLKHLYPLEITAQGDYVPRAKRHKVRGTTSPTRIQPPRRAKNIRSYSV